MRFQRLNLYIVAAAAALALGACGGGGDAVDTAPDGNDGTEVLAAEAVNRDGRVTEPAVLVVPTSSAGNLVCRDRLIGAVRADNIEVPAGAACRLSGTHVDGSITVGAGAQLDARSVVVAGNLAADAAASVMLSGLSTLGGSVQLKQGGAASVTGARIAGDLQIDAMSGQVLANGNRIGGNLAAVGNLGGTTITDNRMQGNLQCKENLPAPQVRNNLAALIEDQCVAAPGTPPGSVGITPAPAGLSGDVSCNNLAIGAVTLGTVSVPANSSCRLDGTRVTGSILVGSNAQVDATGVRVTGNVQADSAAAVNMAGGSVVGGSVQIKQGGGASIVGADITGDLQIDAVRGPVSATSNRVNGSVQVMSNLGGVSMTRNTIGGNLQCKDNVPAPVGSGNRATSKEDQCGTL